MAQRAHASVITPIDVGRLRLDLSDAFGLPPDHPRGGRRDIPLLCHHVATGKRSVLIDAPACEMTGSREIYAVPGYVPPPGLVEQLAGLGRDAPSIDTVIITHAHFDHFDALARLANGERVPSFPRARHYLGAADWPETPDEVEEATLGVVARAGLLELVTGPLDLGDGLVILPAAGETPGHQIVHVSDANGDAFVVGDLYHDEIELDEDARHVRWADVAALRRSRTDLIARASERRARVYFAHIPGAWCVSLDGGVARWTRLEARA